MILYVRNEVYMNQYYGILLSLFTGLATVIGALLVVFNQHKSNKKIVFILGLSTGIMFILGLFELLPESYELISKEVGTLYSVLTIIFLIGVGFFITSAIDKLLHHTEEHELKHVGLITTLAVSMHKLPEGIALFIASYADIKIGIALAFATALHHIPEGMMIALPTYYASNSKSKALKYAALSGMATPLGALLAMLLFKNIISNVFLGGLFAVAIGMFLFVVAVELIPTALQYKYPKMYALAISIGATVMYVIHMLDLGHH